MKQTVENQTKPCIGCGRPTRWRIGVFAICERCDENCRVNDYWDPSTIKPAGWSFGVEIECIPEPYTFAAVRYLTSFGRSFDRSVEPGGVEFISPPLPENLLRAKVIEFCRVFEGTVNNTCGMHIHVSKTRTDLTKGPVSGFSWWEQYRLYAYCKTYEEEIFGLVPPCRRDNQYCAPIAPLASGDASHFPAGNWAGHTPTRTQWLGWLYGFEKQDLKGKYILTHQGNNKYHHTPGKLSVGINNRRWWLNLWSLRAHGTVEIRLHSGTVNPTKILHWATLWRLLIEAAVGGATKSPLELASIYIPETYEYYLRRMKRFKKYDIQNTNQDENEYEDPDK